MYESTEFSEVAPTVLPRTSVCKMQVQVTGHTVRPKPDSSLVSLGLMERCGGQKRTTVTPEYSSTVLFSVYPPDWVTQPHICASRKSLLSSRNYRISRSFGPPPNASLTPGGARNPYQKLKKRTDCIRYALHIARNFWGRNFTSGVIFDFTTFTKS